MFFMQMLFHQFYQLNKLLSRRRLRGLQKLIKIVIPIPNYVTKPYAQNILNIKRYKYTIFFLLALHLMQVFLLYRQIILIAYKIIIQNYKNRQMLIAINVPQSKTVSIAFTSLKASILGMIAIVTQAQITAETKKSGCPAQMKPYFTLLQVFFIICIILDISAMIYFFVSTQFKKVPYYVFYAFHWIVSLVCVFGGLSKFKANPGCHQGYQLIGCLLALSIIYQINNIIAMVGHLYFILKYLHFGSNLVWLVVGYTLFTSKCTNAGATAVVVIHTLLSVFNMFNFIVSRTLGKSSFSAQYWRTFTMISLCLMIVCYLMVLMDNQTAARCNALKFFDRMYVRFGLIQIIPPLLLLIFLKGQSGDPREISIKQGQEQFTKLRQEHHDFTQSI